MASLAEAQMCQECNVKTPYKKELRFHWNVDYNLKLKAQVY